MAPTPAFAVLALLLLPAGAAAATRQVPAQYATIQAAINVSGFGDVIQVAPGTYHEHLIMQKPGVAILGAGPDVTTIHGSSTGRVIEFFAVGASTKLSGFRITGGVAIRSLLASPQILDCIIEGNTAPEGGGIFLTQSRPQIKGCAIRDNVATGSPFEQHDGGGLLLENNSPALIENCEILDNRADSRGAGIRIRDAGAAIVRGCRIRGNAAGDLGGGVAADSPSAGVLFEDSMIDANTAWGGAAGVLINGGTLTRCTIAFNVAEDQTGGIAIGAPGTITRCTIAFNTGTGSASGLLVLGAVVDHTIVARNFNAPGVSGAPSSDPAFSCNDVWGHQFGDYQGANPTGANGNISENPLFSNPGLGDLGLATGSPCSAALNPCGLVGALDVTCAVTESRRSSWGQLKARSR